VWVRNSLECPCEESLTVTSFECEVLCRDVGLFFILKLCAFSRVYVNSSDNSRGISKWLSYEAAIVTQAKAHVLQGAIRTTGKIPCVMLKGWHSAPSHCTNQFGSFLNRAGLYYLEQCVCLLEHIKMYLFATSI
jgi:hypothetical protein